MKPSRILLAILMFYFAVVATNAFALKAGPSNRELGWSIQLVAPEGEGVIYQPQPDSFKGDTIEARAAASPMVFWTAISLSKICGIRVQNHH